MRIDFVHRTGPVPSLRALGAAAGLVVALLVGGIARAGDVVVEVRGFEPADGPVRVAGFASAVDFEADRRVAAVEVAPRGERVVARLVDLPAGVYAIAAYQDRDGNGRLSKNFIGIPKEPYGFSNGARGRLGPPDFDAIAVEVSDDPITVEIVLE